MQAVIIDDEPHAHKVLKALLDQSERKVEVVSSAYNVTDGIRSLKAHDPDIAFVDIKMPDGSGFDLLEKINNTKIKVIFTTAYDEHALKAFKYNALDYLLKPIDPEELERALSKLNPEKVEDELGEKISNVLDVIQKQASQRLAIASHNEIRYITLDEILYLQSDGNYTTMHLSDNEELLIPKTLKEYQDVLPHDQFLRVHQSYIIQAVAVKRFLKDKNAVVLVNGVEIPVSRRKKNDLLDWLEEL